MLLKNFYKMFDKNSIKFLLLLIITQTYCHVIKREIVNEFIDNSNLTLINNETKTLDEVIDGGTTLITPTNDPIDDTQTTTTTERYHFDINKYMTNYNNETQSLNLLIKADNNQENNNNNNDNKNIDETQYDENFKRLLLTTPVTPHFDNEHKKYLQNVNTENLIKINDDETTTNVDDNVKNKYIINDLNMIKENKTDEQKSSIYYNNAEYEHNNYDTSNQEVIETVTNIPNIINQTTEKRGKYLHADSTNDDNNYNKNFMNLSIPNTAEVWALASMKGVEQYKEKIGQFYNVTETKDESKNDTVLTKVLADWAAVMKNDEFNNDTYLTVDPTAIAGPSAPTATGPTDDISNIDSTENLIKLNETNRDQHGDTSSSESKVINNIFITSPPPLEKNSIEDQIGDTSSSVVTVEKLPFTDYRNEDVLSNKTKHNSIEIDDDHSSLNKTNTNIKHDETFFYENALPKEENKTIDVTIQTLENTSEITRKNNNQESIEESELINSDADLEFNPNVQITTERGNKIESIILTTEEPQIEISTKMNEDKLITTTNEAINFETSTIEQLEDLFKTIRINIEETTIIPVDEELMSTANGNFETTTEKNVLVSDETSTVSPIIIGETTVSDENDFVPTTTDNNIIIPNENPLTTESSNETKKTQTTTESVTANINEIDNKKVTTTESYLNNYTEIPSSLDDEEEVTTIITPESTTSDNVNKETTTITSVTADNTELHEVHGLNERINQQTTDINDFNFNYENDSSMTTTEININNNPKTNINETENIIKIHHITTTMETTNSIDYTTETTNIDKLNVESSTYVEQPSKVDVTTVGADVSKRQHETVEEQPGEEMEFNIDTEKISSTTDGVPITNDLNNQSEGLDSNIIIAISVSVVGIVALILLVVVLFIMRKRQKQLTYGQRCRPVGLDAYSLDNVSVYNSVRRKGNNLRLSKRSYGNSAFEDPGLRGNNLSITSLAIFVENKNDIYDEFKEIPQIVARADEVPIGCEGKNRYANVVPLPETRVFLQQVNNDEKTEYINANFVRGPKDVDNYYIACQAPMENTVADFWRMIWEHNSKVIIMATDLSECGIEKCAAYLPPSSVLDCYRLYGDFQVTLKNREVKDKYAVSSVQLKNMLTSTWRELTHFWYQWPDTGVPNDEASVIAMLLEARSVLKMSLPDQSDENTGELNKTSTDEQQKNGSMDKHKSLQRQQGPLTVHCSPGTGRTGTIIACDIALRTLEMPSRSVDVPQIVYSVRRGRASAVRTREQYEFIYKTSHMYATKLTEPVVEN